MSGPSLIRKRNGELVAFDRGRIRKAILAGLRHDLGWCEMEESSAQEEASKIEAEVVRWLGAAEQTDVEKVQDRIEHHLIAAGYIDAAHAFIRYREQRTRERRIAGHVPGEICSRFAINKEFFPTALQQYQHLDKYSRWKEDAGCRETWPETVERVIDYYWEERGHLLPAGDREILYKAILHHEAMPSMRALAMAGPAAKRNNVCLYNCSYQAIDSMESLVSVLHIPMSGCGTGYSVERAATEKLPPVGTTMAGQKFSFIVEDSQEGWEEALRYGLCKWWEGGEVVFDVSAIRPAGSILKTKGGTASGPGPLVTMLEKVEQIVKGSTGRKLEPIELFDILCHIGDCAVQGGVRRSASICLFDFNDEAMLRAKRGNWFKTNPQRRNANISVVIEGASDEEQLDLRFVMHLMDASQSGEPGIFMRDAWHKMSPDRRWTLDYQKGGSSGPDYGTNPCGEILMRTNQFCNLSLAVLVPGLVWKEIVRRVRVAVILGTIQASLTHFPRLPKSWKETCEAEALLGVDLLGFPEMGFTDEQLQELRDIAIATNQEYAEKLGIKPAAAITCNKPNGNLSVLLRTSAGLHRPFAPYYRRNVRVSAKSPLLKVLKNAGFPMSPESGHDPENPNTWVLHFPQKATDGFKTAKTDTALDQLKLWHQSKLHWCEHNPSVTIQYHPDEFETMIAWLKEHRQQLGGLAFLPRAEHNYELAPYEEITREQYEKEVAALPEIDWSLLYIYEDRDQTTAANEPACSAGACDVV